MKKGEIIFLYLCVALLVVFMPSAVYASGYLNIDRQGSITISYVLSDAGFSIYRVADISEDVEFTISGDFVGCQVSLEDLDSNGWRTAAQTLESYVIGKSISGLASGNTDGQGQLMFDGLETGLYLIIGETLVKDGVEYVPSSTLISLPNLDTDGNWDYEPEVSPKYETNEQEPDTSGTPTGQETETETEQETEKKTTGGSTTGGSATGESTTGGSTTGESTTGESDADESTTKKSTAKKSSASVDDTDESAAESDLTETESEETKLPQTGQLWWPIPYMALAGILLVLLGVLMKKKKG